MAKLYEVVIINRRTRKTASKGMRMIPNIGDELLVTGENGEASINGKVAKRSFVMSTKSHHMVIYLELE